MQVEISDIEEDTENENRKLEAQKEALINSTELTPQGILSKKDKNHAYSVLKPSVHILSLF